MPRPLILFFIYNFFAFGLAAAPFQYFFFTSRGISFAQFAWLSTIYYAVMVACDVPAGVLADRFGRKFVLILGPLGLASGFGLCLAGNSFEMFAFANAVTGIGHALISGATSSFLYDSLKERGEELHFLRLESLATTLRLVGTSIAFFLGGWIAKEFGGLEGCFWATAGLTGFAGLIACFFREPKVHEIHHLSMKEIFRGSLGAILHDRAIRWVTIYFAILFIWLRLSFHTYQAKFEEIGVTDFFTIGFVYALLNVSAALCSRIAPRIQRVTGETLLFMGMQACLVLSFAVLGVSSANWAFLLFFVQQIPFGLHFPIISNYVNQKIPSSQRTTILSFQSMAGRLAFSVFFPLFGWWESKTSLNEAFLLSAGLGAIGMVWLVWRYPKQSGVAANAAKSKL